MTFAVVGCTRCGSLRVVEEGRKSAQCPRCSHRIDLTVARRHFQTSSAEEARLYLGAANREGAKRRGGRGRLPETTPLDLGAPAPQDARSVELRRIGQSLGAARGPGGRLRAILRKGFEAFGQLTADDLDAIARAGELEESGQELAEAALDQGLAGRGPGGALIPLREGK